MKKTRKLLSIVLSLLVVFGSLPVVYTAAADAVTYALGETGTIDNPTHPVSADGVFSHDDLYKLNIDVENTKYTFYQTMNDEYFTYTQILGLQQRNDVPVSGRTFKFVGVEHYTGGTNATTTNSDGSAQGTDLMEVPAITNNTTTEFLNTYYVPTHTWAAINSNASELSSTPSNVQLQGSVADVSGCRNYSWSDTYVVKGHSASTTGEINTGYYEAYNWNWSTNDASAAFELRLQTSIRILDARKLANEIKEAEEVLANPEKYTDAYISSVEATLNTLPEDLKDFSKVYDQATIDKYADMLEDVSLNSADYTEFNRTFENLKGITNALGGFTDDSFSAFQVEIEKINNNLPKNLDYTKQSVVDEATQALRDAYNLLVTKGDASGGTYTNTTQDVKFTIQNEFNLIQIKDDQNLSYTQFWSIDRRNLESKDSRRMFYSVIDSSSAFTSRFTDAAVDTVSSLSAKAIDGSLSNALIFTCWDEVLSDGSVNPSTEVINRTNHTIDGSYSGFEKDKDYYIENSPLFKGLSATETGAHTFTYNQTVYLNWQQNYVIYTKNNYSNFAFTTTVNITDARALVKAVAEANAIIANPGSYSDNYISALQAAVDAVPVELTRGVKYYTQEEVDAYLNAITSVQEGCADYSEFNEAYEELINMKNNSTYTDESFDAFIEEIQNINKNLPKDLPASEQATVDAATEALHKATHHLVYYKLNSDNVFTEEDIPEDLGFSPLSFSLSSTNYEFMQVADGQQFAIRTDFSAKNTDSSYTLRLLSLGFSTVNAGNKTTICDGRTTPDKGCHNAGNVPASAEGYTFFDLATYASTSGTITGITSYTADDAGDTGEFNSWVNTDGKALSSNGVLTDGVELNLSKSAGYATYIYTAPSDATSGEVNIYYAFRLGWSYEQFWGENIRRHVHIPVYLKITDARALHNLYNEVEDILNGETDKSYTLSSLVSLYNAFNKVPSDMASGEAYYTQSDVNTKYDELKAAYDTLVEGADYSEFFEAYVKAQEIINTNNKDSAGNSLYDDTAYETFNQQFTDIITSLDMNLPASEQTTVDGATTALNNALAALEATKHADYSEFNDALAEVEKILKEEQENPGTYTQSSLEAIQNAYNDAVALNKELPASEQATVDAVTEALKEAAENKKYKADYSEFEDAYSQVKDIVDNPDKYTDATVDAAEKALEEADKLNKDLPDTAANRVTIEDATNALQSVFDNAKEKANYDGLDEALEGAKEIVNAPEGTYTEESVKNAQDAIDAAEALEKDLEKNDENQQKINDVIQDLIDAKENAKEKANYDGLDEALEDAKEIVNAPEGTYTEESVKKAQDAIDAAESLNKDLEKNDENQQKINDVIQDLIDAKEDAKNKANYTDYNNAKSEADSLVNDDGNGNPIYDEDAFNEYKEAIENIDSKLNKELTSDDQAIVDKATSDLEDLKATLEAKKYYTVTFKDAEGNVLGTSSYVNGDVFGNLTAPALPEDTDTTVYVGWIYADGTLAKADDVVNGDMDVTVASESKKLIAKDESGVAIDEVTSFISGIEAGTTVEEVLSKFDNDELVIEIKTFEGVELSSEALVGTGSTITLKSKYTGVVYETRMFIIMGDVDGDGDIDDTDFEISKSVGFQSYTYPDEHNYFFVANDIDENGIINVLDAFYIGRMKTV